MSMNVVTLNDKIHRRSGHIAVPYKNTMIVWGGYMERVLDADLDLTYSVYHYTDELWVFNCFNEVWDRVLTKGQIPPKVSGCCAIIDNDNLYIFGGIQCSQEIVSLTGATNQLYCLNLITKRWTLLEPLGTQPLACDKLTGWLYNDKLYFFGGFGPAPNTYYPFEHVVETSSEDSLWPVGWNNQLVVYNIQENSWEWPRTKGTPPTPRAAHAGDITGSMVYIFGGRLRHIRNNELYSLDMKTMTWSDNLTGVTKSDDQEIPEGRTWHSLNFISPNRAVVYGGLSQHNAVLSDCWLMDVEPGTADVKFHFKVIVNNPPLLLHKSVFFPKSVELLIHGGLKRSILTTVTWKVSCTNHLSTHFNDCWMLTLSHDGVFWREFKLAYDHGEPRCWHTACVLSLTPKDKGLVLHSGVTQPYYETALKLKPVEEYGRQDVLLAALYKSTAKPFLTDL